MNAQFPDKLSFLFRPARFKTTHGGRGSGKSWGYARALLILGAQKPMRILCTREVQKSIKDSVHKLLGDQIQKLGLGGFYQVLETQIRGKNGTEFIFAGLAEHTVESIKSYEGVDIVWVEEAQAVSKRSWDILIPTIRKPGSEIWATLNPELEDDDTYQRLVAHPAEGSVVVDLNWRDNPWWDEIQEKNRLDTLKRDPENYENIWEGKPKRTVDGAIYVKEIDKLYEDKRIRNVPYDPLLKVHTVWDLGWNDAMTIIMVQRSSSEIRVIDYIEDSHKTLDEYVALLEKKEYRWGTDFLPHDGAARDFKTGKTSQEMLQAMKRRVQIVENMSIENGIKAARMIFSRCYFDETKAGKLVARLKRYRRSIPTTTGEPAAPLHDENSHGADAFRYLAIVADQLHNHDWQDSGKIKYPDLGIA